MEPFTTLLLMVGTIFTLSTAGVPLPRFTKEETSNCGYQVSWKIFCFHCKLFVQILFE